MQYEIEITETLQRTETIEAECLGEAIDKAMDMYYKQQIVLDAEDMKGVEFTQLGEDMEEKERAR